MNPLAHATMTANAQRILVVDDDPEIRKLLARYIESQGFRVLLAANCRELRDQLATHQIDLIVLDVMLPDGSGLDLCRDLRAQRSERADHPADRAQGGRRPHHRARDRRRRLSRQAVQSARADRPRARGVAAARRGRRPSRARPRSIVFEGFTADPQTRRVTDPEGGSIELTGAEFDLLKTFLDRPGRVLSRDQLLDMTRGREGDVLDRSIDVLVSRLRRKLGEGGMSHLFKTVRNGGYQLTVKVEVQDEAP